MTSPEQANSKENWDKLWSAEGDDTWRTYPKLYSRIVELVPEGASVLDLGCGVGKLLDRLKDEKNCITWGLDISPEAIEILKTKGRHDYGTMDLNIPQPFEFSRIQNQIIIATEVLEHLPDDTLDRRLKELSKNHCIFAVPNNCLGPDVEPQHYRKWTAIEFKRFLLRYFDRVRVECIDDGAPRLLAVCNEPKHAYKLAFTMPIKNEADDLERVLKSFRGACDYMVIGIDDKTTDNSKEIALLYADEVFDFTWQNNFSAARNECIDHCRNHLTSHFDWIFMSEGHEHLEAGLDQLLSLDQVPQSVKIIEVRREDRSHAWMFPWLFRNQTDIYFKNPVHNTLFYDDAYQVAQMPSIRTWHARSHKNAKERELQRRTMNRQELIKKLKENPKDTRSCYYLANEWRGATDVKPSVAITKAIDLYRRYLDMGGKNGPERYQARLALAGCLDVKQEHLDKTEDEKQETRTEQYETLVVATREDWSRTEHWLKLGEFCTKYNKLDMALKFFELAATGIGREPLTFMWLEKEYYTWLPAQKLTETYAALGMLDDALIWCDKVKDLLPDWAPEQAKAEVELVKQAIINKLQEKNLNVT